MNLTYIRIPLHKLNYVNNIEEAMNFTQEFEAGYKSIYDLETRSNIFEQLEWARKNREYDLARFAKLEGKYTNEQILKYVDCIYDFLLERKLFE